MRYLVLALFLVTLASPAWAAFRGPSAMYTPVTTVEKALEAEEGATCVLEGNITEHVSKDRYIFKDATGTIAVHIPPHVFGNLDIAPEHKIRLTGEIRGKKMPNRQDSHIGARYIELLKK